MKKVILDTSFILSCAKQKIDFFEEIELRGLKILIPAEVIKEIKSIADSKKIPGARASASLSLKILEKNSYEKINLSSKNVDKGIIKLANENHRLIVATLDAEIKSKVPNQKLVIREKKKLEII